MRKDQFIKFWIAHPAAVSSSGYCDEATALFARMTALGETPTDARKTAINNCIVSLKAAGLFATQWDDLVVTKGHAAGSCLLNWILNATNGLAVNSPLFVADTGYKKNAATAYINTKYNLSTESSLFTQNDASWIMKISAASTGAGTKFHGAVNASAQGVDFCVVTNNRMNGATVIGTGYTNGWNALIRTSSTAGSTIINSTETPFTSNTSAALPSLEPFIFRLNYSTAFDVDTTEVNECYAFGKSLTLVQFETFQGIMNTYFATF